MTVEEARSFLGIAPDADSNTVRRAYLRLLKHHKPDVDPEGFQRLREAYELAASWVGVEWADEAEAEWADEGTEVDWDRWVSTEQAVDDQIDGARDEDRAATAAGPGSGVAAELKALESLAEDAPERLQRLRDLVEAWPTVPQARWALIHGLAASGRGEEIPEVLRAGDAAGIDACFETLASQWPEALLAEEIRRGAEHETATVRLAVATSIAESRPSQAASITVGALTPDDPIPPILRLMPCLRIFLLLQAAGEVGYSATVDGAMEA